MLSPRINSSGGKVTQSRLNERSDTEIKAGISKVAE
jgi:hypothetical protein